MGTSGHCDVCGAAERNTRLCQPCADELGRAIGDFPSLLHELSVWATGQAKVYRAAPARRGPDEELAGLEEEYGHRMAAIPARLRSRDGRLTLTQNPLPCNLDARDMLTDAYDTLLTWACLVGADEISSKRVVAWLLSNMGEIRIAEDAAQCFDEITYLHRRIEQAVDRTPPRIYAGPCDNEDCKQLDADGNLVSTGLYAPWAPAKGNDEHAAEMDDREFACDGFRTAGAGCGWTYTWTDRRPWLIDTIKTSLVAIDDLLEAVPVLFPKWNVPRRLTVLAWVRQDRLVSPQNDPATGEPLYPGDEFLTLIENYKPREYVERPNRKKKIA